MLIKAFSPTLLAILIAVLSFTPPHVLSQDTLNKIDKKTYDTIRNRLSKNFPSDKVGELKLHPTVLPGILEASMGDLSFYVDAGGKYLISGEIYDLLTRTKISTHNQRAHLVQHLQRFGKENMVSYSAKESKNILYVLTDVTCPYCVKFHKNIEALLKKKISVYYVLFSRNGHSTANAKKMKNIYCYPKAQRPALFNRLILKKTIKTINCNSDIMKKSDALAKQINLKGTPMLITGDGREIGGYLSVESIVAHLNK